RKACSALHYRDYRLLWIGQLFSVTGSQMQVVAINWHVWLLTKSALALGGVGLVRVIPIVACSLIGGAVADVFDRKRLMMITQAVMLLSATLLAIWTRTGLHSVWPIYVLTGIGSAAVAFDAPARQALIPMLVPVEDFPNAVSLYSVVFQVALIGGPAISGLILARYSPAVVYGINGASFLAVIAALLMMRVRGKPSESDGIARSVTLQSIREGLRFVWRTPIIVQTMTLDFIATFFASSTTLLPIFADQILRVGARGLGILASAPAVGSLMTGLVMARVHSFKRQGPTVLASVAFYGAATIGFGVSKVFALSLVMLALVGASDTVSTVLRQTIRQMVTPDYLRGRMTSVNMIFFMGGPQLGEFEAGTLAKFVGAPLSVIAGGVGCVIAVALAALRAKSLIEYESHLKPNQTSATEPAD
ncbi:MAG TPA: MFS transporter, partial [Blastocatellia bacterium]|nr:MFS transporter [Blastocatellia bacterium]